MIDEKEKEGNATIKEEKGIYNIYDIDKEIIQNIEIKKNDLLLNFFDLSNEIRIKAILNLIFSMKSLIQKYNDDYLTEKKVKINDKEYNFYDLEKEFLFNDISVYSQYVYFEKILYIYNKFIGRYLNIKLPTEKINLKKKIIERMFSLTNINYQKLLDEYEIKRKELNLPNTKLVFLSFLLSKLSNFDMSYKIIINGYERIGKSTLALIIAYYYNIFKFNYINIDSFVKQNIFFNVDKPIELQKENIYIFDEASLISDKRLSMMLKQINLIKTFRINAYLNNVFLILSQDFTDLDIRLINSSNMLIHLYKRGLGFVYIFKQNITSTKRDFIESFRQINDLSNEKIQMRKLKQLSPFIFSFRFKDISIENYNEELNAVNLLYKDVKQFKLKEINNKLDFF